MTCKRACLMQSSARKIPHIKVLLKTISLDKGACVTKSRLEKNVKEFILIGNTNEDAEGSAIRNFVLENGSMNAYQHTNNIDRELDNDYKHKKKGH